MNNKNKNKSKSKSKKKKKKIKNKIIMWMSILILWMVLMEHLYKVEKILIKNKIIISITKAKTTKKIITLLKTFFNLY